MGKVAQARTAPVCKAGGQGQTLPPPTAPWGAYKSSGPPPGRRGPARRWQVNKVLSVPAGPSACLRFPPSSLQLLRVDDPDPGVPRPRGPADARRARGARRTGLRWPRPRAPDCSLRDLQASASLSEWNGWLSHRRVRRRPRTPRYPRTRRLCPWALAAPGGRGPEWGRRAVRARGPAARGGRGRPPAERTLDREAVCRPRSPGVKRRPTPRCLGPLLQGLPGARPPLPTMNPVSPTEGLGACGCQPRTRGCRARGRWGRCVPAEGARPGPDTPGAARAASGPPGSAARLARGPSGTSARRTRGVGGRACCALLFPRVWARGRQEGAQTGRPGSGVGAPWRVRGPRRASRPLFTLVWG